MAEKETQSEWFGRGLRTKMAPELAEREFATTASMRKALFNEAGKDVRLITPGLRWSYIDEKKAAIRRDFREKVQDAFDELYERITGGKRCVYKARLWSVWEMGDRISRIIVVI